LEKPFSFFADIVPDTVGDLLHPETTIVPTGYRSLDRIIGGFCPGVTLGLLAAYMLGWWLNRQQKREKQAKHFDHIGRGLFDIRDEDGIWTVPAEGGEAVQLTNSEGWGSVGIKVVNACSQGFQS